MKLFTDRLAEAPRQFSIPRRTETDDVRKSGHVRGSAFRNRRLFGTKPAADTRFGSSNTADPTAKVCDDCTGNAFRNSDVFDFSNRYCPSSGGIFAVHTPITKDRPSTDSG